MNRNQFQFIPHVYVDIPEPKVEQEDSPNKEILDEIFKVDPATGLPRNDQEVFLSDKTNPLIKDFIAQVLRGNQQPNVDNTYKDLSDDVIAELTIQHGESRVAYLDRITKYLDNQKDSIIQIREEIGKIPNDKSTKD